MITREQYMANTGPEWHRDYYRQFVTGRVLEIVARGIGVEAIITALAAGDKHLNTIPLYRWDQLQSLLPRDVLAMVKQAGDCYSMSTGTCIFKQAANMLAEQGLNILATQALDAAEREFGC